MENVLFKISYPAEFPSQTAVEAAVTLHGQLAALVVLQRIFSASRFARMRPRIRIIDKQGALHNPADRDHCIQYMVAVPLLFGRLTAENYEDGIARDPRIDELLAKIVCVEDPAFTADYHAPEKRSIANALKVELSDGTVLPEVVVEYPIGHRFRRAEGIPLLIAKFKANFLTRFAPEKLQRIQAIADQQDTLETTAVDAFMDLLVQ